MKPAETIQARDRVVMKDRLRRLAIRSAIAIVGVYLLGTTAGFIWLRNVRHVDQVGYLDLATLNLTAIHRGIAVEQFARARREWDAKSYRAAYVVFISALRHDPANISGRLEAADFFVGIGAPAMAQNILSDGLALSPQEPRLIKRTFGLLIGSGRDREALRLLGELYPDGFAGPNAADLETYDLFATLTAEGPQAAAGLVAKYPQLSSHPTAAPVLARVAWENNERSKAMRLLRAYLDQESATYADFVRLAGWQMAGGSSNDALETATLACARFPAELQPRVLKFEMQASRAPGGIPTVESLEEFLREFGGKPEALSQLASLCGNHGWVDLARMLYELGVTRRANLPHLALSYSDALMTRKRFLDAMPILSAVELQLSDDDIGLAVRLRQRQVIGSAAIGDSTNVREYARRLGSLVGNNPEALDMCRRLFERMGIADAVDELTPRAKKPTTVAENK